MSRRQITALSVDILYKALSDCILAGPLIGHSVFGGNLQLGHFIGGLVHGALVFLLIEGLLLREVLEGLCLDIPAEKLVGVLNVLTKLPAFLSKELSFLIIAAGNNSQGIEEKIQRPPL